MALKKEKETKIVCRLCKEIVDRYPSVKAMRIVISSCPVCEAIMSADVDLAELQARVK